MSDYIELPTVSVVEANWLSSNGQHGHWKGKNRAVSNLRRQAYYLYKGITIPADWGYPVTVHAVIGYSKTTGRADPANAYPTVKPLIDGATDAGVWPDDSDSYVMGPMFWRDPTPSAPGTHTVRIVITKGSETPSWL